MRLIKWLFIGSFVLLAAYHFYPKQTRSTLSTGFDKSYRAARELGK